MDGSVERVVIWGFMASGKSTVGHRLAARLGWHFVDIDHEIVRRAGRSIAEIFRDEGEPAFRRLEAEVTRELIGRPGTVFSTGGGWVANSEASVLLPAATLSVWLRVSPEAVLLRVHAEVGGAERPLLQTPDPDASVRRLLRAREPLYRRADLAIETAERTPDEIAEQIESTLRPRLAGEELFS